MNDSERAGVIKAVIESSLTELNVSIPAKVVRVTDGDKVTVIPDINKVRMLKDGSKDYETTTEIDNVPVINPSCDGFSISMPLKEGCKGLLVFCDYDLDNWIDGTSNDPHTDRYHDQNDCFFFPAFNGGRNDGDCLELKSNTVTVKICHNGFDVEYGGQSMVDSINNAMRACGCSAPLAGWKP